MAKQVGPLYFTGTVDGVIFYKLGDQYYLRSKGDYKSGKQMRKDYRYKRTLQQADRFGAASKLVKPIYYRYLPKVVRKHGLFGKLTGKVNRWLQEGKPKEEVQALLVAYCQSLVPKAKATATSQPTAVVTQPTTNTQLQTTVSELSTTDNQLRTTVNAQPTTINKPPKKARYLSNWKVKTNGRLQLPSLAEQVLSTHSKESYSLTILVRNSRKPSKLPQRDYH